MLPSPSARTCPRMASGVIYTRCHQMAEPDHGEQPTGGSGGGGVLCTDGAAGRGGAAATEDAPRPRARRRHAQMPSLHLRLLGPRPSLHLRLAALGGATLLSGHAPRHCVVGPRQPRVHRHRCRGPWPCRCDPPCSRGSSTRRTSSSARTPPSCAGSSVRATAPCTRRRSSARTALARPSANSRVVSSALLRPRCAGNATCHHVPPRGRELHHGRHGP